MSPLQMFATGLGLAFLGWLLHPEYRQPLKEILLTMIRPGYGLIYTLFFAFCMAISLTSGGIIGELVAGISGVAWFTLCWLETWHQKK